MISNISELVGREYFSSNKGTCQQNAETIRDTEGKNLFTNNTVTEVDAHLVNNTVTDIDIQ